MSNYVQSWNREQVKIHNIGVDPILLKNDDKDNCYQNYNKNRSLCIRDSGLCNFQLCDSKNPDILSNNLCYYENEAKNNYCTYPVNS